MAIDGKMIALIVVTGVFIVLSIIAGGYSRQPAIGACLAFITTTLAFIAAVAFHDKDNKQLAILTADKKKLTEEHKKLEKEIASTETCRAHCPPATKPSTESCASFCPTKPSTDPSTDPALIPSPETCAPFFPDPATPCPSCVQPSPFYQMQNYKKSKTWAAEYPINDDTREIVASPDQSVAHLGLDHGGCKTKAYADQNALWFAYGKDLEGKPTCYIDKKRQFITSMPLNMIWQDGAGIHGGAGTNP